MVERGSKVSYEKRSNEVVPCPMSPHRGKRTGKDPSNQPPISTPMLAEARGSKYILRAGKDS
jgi:hypothetical protein